MKAAAIALALALAGCGKYADFRLPVAHETHETALNTGVEHAKLDERESPIIVRGNALDVLAPTVVNGRIIYSEWDGRMWHTAEGGARKLSPDARTWEGSYIAGNGSALDVGGQVWYWYVAGPRERPKIGLARDWRKEARPVLETGPYLSWDEYGVADPYVIRVGGFYYMYFLGEDRGWRQRIGIARSGDGIHWVKLRTNPVLELGDPGSFDENGLGEPAVWQAQGFYWMLYTGRAANETRKLGLARSVDGVHWTKTGDVFGGARAWDSKVICDPHVEIIDGTRVGVWFGGGDAASPDENLHGQIGYGELRMVAK